MSDTVQPVNPIFQDPADAMGNFFFLIFTADPMKDKVKIWVDEGTVKLTMKREKFYKLIERLIDFKTSCIVHEACTTYGCFYALDRANKTIEKLHANAEKKHLNPAADFMRVHNKLLKKADSLETQYSQSLDDYTAKGLAESWISKHHNNEDNENRII